MMKKFQMLFFVLFLFSLSADARELVNNANNKSPIAKTFIRTENYPRPPYSGATYYIYERNGKIICTKLEVCNKYDHCETQYKPGAYKDEKDIGTGKPYGKTDAVAIPKAKLRSHRCLSKYKLL